MAGKFGSKNQSSLLGRKGAKAAKKAPGAGVRQARKKQQQLEKIPLGRRGSAPREAQEGIKRRRQKEREILEQI